MAVGSVSTVFSVPTVNAVGAADVESMRFNLVLPASDRFAVGKMKTEGPGSNVYSRRRQALPDQHLLPHEKLCTSSHVGGQTSGGRRVGVAHVSVVLGMTQHAGGETVPRVIVCNRLARGRLRRDNVGSQ